MTDETDRDLPLHDEAKARGRWRGGETILDKGELGTAGPASEADDAAQGAEEGEGGAAEPVARGLAKRPPD